jgi:segregation and condensation protein B
MTNTQTTLSPIKRLIEAAIFSSPEPVSLEKLKTLLAEEALSHKDLEAILQELQEDYSQRGIALQEVANGYRFQIQADLTERLTLWMQQRTPRYSRAFLETLALIAYRQPITRAEIEDIRGVVISSHILRSLQDREWVKVIGHREVPGRPALYATTSQFLDYFNLKRLEELPALGVLKEEN